jgi:fumarylacetoacetate (FAA) hydrolase
LTAPVRLVTLKGRDGSLRVGELTDDEIALLAAPSMLGWLAGEGRERTGETLPAERAALLAPVPEPPSLRDFFAFESHVAAGWRLRGAEIPAYWYQAPAFYFSNPASILGPGEPVSPPAAVERLDCELELAAVIGVPEGGGDPGIAGFTLMNDWSARDLQAQEMTVGLGPHKSKDFATSLGPWLVAPDELGYAGGRLPLEAGITVNGHEISRCDASEQHFPWPELVAQAARSTRLRPGDVLGSGTLAGGCLLELGPLPPEAGGDGERWLEPGDVVALEAPGLGRLETPIS